MLVSYNGSVGIGTTLVDAIGDALNEAPEPGEPSEEPTEDPEEQPSTDPSDPPEDDPSEEPKGTQAKIRDLLKQADAAFAEADQAQRDGNTVKWARLMEQARSLIEQAIELSEG